MGLHLCSQEKAYIPDEAPPSKAAPKAHVDASSSGNHIASSPSKMGREKAHVLCHQLDSASTVHIAYLKTHQCSAL
jgi:hypothetical protein